jgi:hypothetical protein
VLVAQYIWMALQPHGHHNECDDTQNRDQAGHDSGYRIRHGANLGPERLHMLSMLDPGQRQARETDQDHRHPNNPATDDRAPMLLGGQVFKELEVGEIESDSILSQWPQTYRG